jgi:hypothetical protein
MLKILKKRDNKLNQKSVMDFYITRDKFNIISDVTGVITMNFKQLCKNIDKTYNLSYTIIKNEEKKSIVVAKGDYVKKYIIIETIDDILDSDYKFGRYI